MGSICGGGSTTSTYQPAGLNNLQTIYGTALNAASQPYQSYTGQLVAGLTPTQQSGINNVNASYGMAQPYLNTAASYAASGAAPVSNVSAGDISQYMSPYNTNVVNATMANINDTNAQQQQQLLGGAAQQGALGGDRVGVAQAELARQQDLASNQTLAGLQNQNYSQALGEANTQQQNEQTNAQRQAQAAFTYGNLGTTAQNAALSGAQAQIGAGTLEQQTNQAGLTAQYQQYLQALAFPYQQSQFLAGIGIPASTAMGGTQTTTPPPPSLISQLGGLGLLGIGLGLRRGGRIPKFADGGATNFMQTPGYIPLGIQISGGQQPQMQNLTQAQPANPMANLTNTANLMKALGIGPAGNSAGAGATAGAGGAGGAVMDAGTLGGTGGALGGLFARGGLVDAVHHIRRGLKRYDDGGNVLPNGSVWDISTGSQPMFPQAADFGLMGWPSRTSPPDNPMYNPATDTGNFVPASTTNSDQLGAALLQKYNPDFPIVTTAPPDGGPTNVAAAPPNNDPEANAGSTDGGPLAYTDQPARPPLPISPFPVPPSTAGNVDQGTMGGTGGLSPNGPTALSPQGTTAGPPGSQGALPPQGNMSGRTLFGRPLTDDRMALIAAGLGIMGQRSPYPLMNIGQGGLQGLQALESQRKASQEDLTVQQRGQQLAQQAEQFAKTFGLQTQQFEETKRKDQLAALQPIKIGSKLNFMGQEVPIFAIRDPNNPTQLRMIDPSTGRIGSPIDASGNPSPAPNATPTGAPAGNPQVTGNLPAASGDITAPPKPIKPVTSLDDIDYGLKGDDFLKQLPGPLGQQVKDYVAGLTMPTGNPRTGDPAIVKKLAGIYGAGIGVPADDTTFAARRTMRNQLSSSAPSSLGGQLNIGNTAVGHLEDLSERALALGNWNSGFAPLTSAINSVRGLSDTQASKLDALKSAAQHYGQEITKFYAGSPGGEAERNRFMESVNGAHSGERLAQVIATEAALMKDRLGNIGSQIQGTLGDAGTKQYPVVRPQSVDAFAKIQANVDRLNGVQPAANTSAPYRVKQNGHTYERQSDGTMKAID